MSNCHQINSSSDALAAAIAAEIASNLYSFPSSNTSAVKVPVSSSTSSANAAMNIGARSNSSSGDDNNVLSETDCDVDNNENDDDENNNNDSNSNNNDNEDDTERRLARSRERNREHARRTRRRKKVQLEVLQEKVKNLRGENKALKQSLEACTIASILVGFSGVTDDDVDNDHDHDATIQSLIKEATDLESKDIFKTTIGGIGPGGKRKRFVSDASESDIAATATDADDCSSPSSAATGNNNNTTTTTAAAVSFPLKLEINGRIVLIGGDGRTHINWKTGIYTDDNSIRSQLTKQQLESLRRERNRIHAKMTRDRKKSFIVTIEKTIEELESSNQRMNAVLKDVKSQSPSTKLVTSASASTSTSMMFFKKKKMEEEKKIDSTNVGSSSGLLPRAVSLSDLAPITPISASSSSIESENNPSDVLNTDMESSKRPKIIHGFSLQY